MQIHLHFIKEISMMTPVLLVRIQWYTNFSVEFLIEISKAQLWWIRFQNLMCIMWYIIFCSECKRTFPEKNCSGNVFRKFICKLQKQKAIPFQNVVILPYIYETVIFNFWKYQSKNDIDGRHSFLFCNFVFFWKWRKGAFSEFANSV